MNKIFVLTAIAIFAFSFTSCEKDEGKKPDISFKTGGSYISGDQTVGMNDTLIIGINAAKTEDKDVLKTFDASVAYDGGASSSIYNETLSGAMGDNYSKDMTIITRNSTGTEKYTFTIVNRDGLTNSVSLILTVK